MLYRVQIKPGTNPNIYVKKTLCFIEADGLSLAYFILGMKYQKYLSKELAPYFESGDIFNRLIVQDEFECKYDLQARIENDKVNYQFPDTDAMKAYIEEVWEAEVDAHDTFGF